MTDIHYYAFKEADATHNNFAVLQLKKDSTIRSPRVRNAIKTLLGEQFDLEPENFRLEKIDCDFSDIDYGATCTFTWSHPDYEGVAGNIEIERTWLYTVE